MNKNIITNITVVSVFCLCLLKSALGFAESKSGVSSSIVFTASMGSAVGQVGAYTKKELSKKKDPLAYVYLLPNDFDVSNDGTLYILDTKNNRVQIANNNGKIRNIISGCGENVFRFPIKLALMGNRSVLVTNAYTDLNIISENGQCVKYIDYDVFHKYGMGTDIIGLYQDSDLNIHVLSEGKEIVFSEKAEFINYDNSATRRKNKRIEYIKNIIGMKLDGYKLYGWKIAVDGNVYAMAINDKTRNNAFRIYRFYDKNDGQLGNLKPDAP